MKFRDLIVCIAAVLIPFAASAIGVDPPEGTLTNVEIMPAQAHYPDAKGLVFGGRWNADSSSWNPTASKVIENWDGTNHVNEFRSYINSNLEAWCASGKIDTYFSDGTPHDKCVAITQELDFDYAHVTHILNPQPSPLNPASCNNGGLIIQGNTAPSSVWARMATDSATEPTQPIGHISTACHYQYGGWMPTELYCGYEPQHMPAGNSATPFECGPVHSCPSVGGWVLAHENPNYCYRAYCKANEKRNAVTGACEPAKCADGSTPPPGGRCPDPQDDELGEPDPQLLSEIGGCKDTNIIDVGNPIRPFTTNKFQKEVLAQGFIPVTASFNSVQDEGGERQPLGKRWTTNLHRRIFDFSSTVAVLLEDGSTLTFSSTQSGWVSNGNPGYELIEQRAQGKRRGWLLVRKYSKSNELYDKDGLLLQVSQPDGSFLKFSWPDPNDPSTILYSSTPSENGYTAPSCTRGGGQVINLLSCVTDNLGREVSFEYNGVTLSAISDTANRKSSITVLKSATQGAYSGLSSITYPDGSSKQFHYGEISSINDGQYCELDNSNRMALLTGVSVNAIRYATYKYDCAGRAVSTEHAGGAEKFVISYPSGTGIPASASITTPSGASLQQVFSTIAGANRPSSVDQPAGAGCPASAASLSYTSKDALSSKTDFNGNQTKFGHDSARGLQIWRVEGLKLVNGQETVVPETRTITTTYHASVDKPIRIAEYSGSVDANGSPQGTLLRSTSYTYDDVGNVMSKAIKDEISGKSIQWSWTYTTRGRVLTETDPIKGNTIYTYYSDTDSDTAKRGNLASVTNSLQETTTINEYTLAGMPLKVTDPNGVVTQYNYDGRDRVISITAAGETSSFEYTPMGSLSRQTHPDGSTITYSYDAAYRLTGIQDSLGNRIAYTLDSSGNRIKEETFDSQGALTSQIMRTYDVLNRLQKVSGGSN